jgi:hypothetical protein
LPRTVSLPRTVRSPRGEFAEDGNFAEEGELAQDGNFAQEGNVAEEGGIFAEDGNVVEEGELAKEGNFAENGNLATRATSPRTVFSMKRASSLRHEGRIRRGCSFAIESYYSCLCQERRFCQGWQLRHKGWPCQGRHLCQGGQRHRGRQLLQRWVTSPRRAISPRG